MEFKRLKKYIVWILTFCLVFTVVLGNSITANAVKKKSIKSITVRIDNKEVTKSTYTLQRGEKAILKVSVSPKVSMKYISFKSSKKNILTVDSKGEITANSKGTAKIRITVYGKYKNKFTWIKIKVIDSDTAKSDNSGEKSLIVYFSKTGTTEKAANEIYSLIGGDIVKLETVKSYPTSYSECLKVAQEEKENNVRPELSTQIENMDDYNVIYVGYPKLYPAI